MEKGENRQHLTRYGHEKALQILREKHGERFIDYRKKWDLATNDHQVFDRPLFVELCINSDCNLKCKMCLRNYDESLSRVHENMSLDLLDKIVKQCRDMQLPSILIGDSAECLLHPQIKEVISKITQINAVDVFIITNGILLTEEIAEHIIDNGIDRLEISIDAANTETYKKIRGGDLERLENNINRFLEIRKEKGVSTPILRLSFCQMKENEAEESLFYEKWKDKADIVDYQKLIDMSRVVNGLQKMEYKEFYCGDPFQRVVIDYKGDMFACCSFGYSEYYKIGNMNEMTILEAWNSDVMKNLRNSFIQQNISQVCLNCRGCL